MLHYNYNAAITVAGLLGISPNSITLFQYFANKSHYNPCNHHCQEAYPQNYSQPTKPRQTAISDSHQSNSGPVTPGLTRGPIKFAEWLV